MRLSTAPPRAPVRKPETAELHGRYWSALPDVVREGVLVPFRDPKPDEHSVASIRKAVPL